MTYRGRYGVPDRVFGRRSRGTSTPPRPIKRGDRALQRRRAYAVADRKGERTILPHSMPDHVEEHTWYAHGDELNADRLKRRCRVQAVTVTWSVM